MNIEKESQIALIESVKTIIMFITLFIVILKILWEFTKFIYNISNKIYRIIKKKDTSSLS
ncbi:hypothetical protein [Arcobacter defluvii]|uniref:Uncharacterized protein n=1 Tax=Arcobacter defluvii TaxID=873191 RepID=A0AAE7E774_9BACT|nr:hypothetical protein [Arcobacter defluvii]QKF77269.1 hypothetical protein ADFLV_1237 [Arcobacter defluvii]QKF77887.1 hypothetical protein ADFLV_1869 [Arcobacter defluvii]RXI32668.1 hypothetical protein CP964_07320 [Arcobacter defluvii]